MNINAQYIESLGGLVVAEIELSTPDLPEVDEQEVITYLFDGFGVAQHEELYLFLSYPDIGNARMDEQIRRTINQNSYGNRLPDNFKITVDDLAICYAEVEEISHEEYVRQLMKGIFSNSKSLFKGTKMTAENFQEYNLRIIKNPCKNLFIFKSRAEFEKELDGKIYAISDIKGDFLCYVLEEDMTALEDQDIVSNGQITSADSIEYIYSQRVEIILLTNPTKK